MSKKKKKHKYGVKYILINIKSKQITEEKVKIQMTHHEILKINLWNKGTYTYNNLSCRVKIFGSGTL